MIRSFLKNYFSGILFGVILLVISLLPAGTYGSKPVLSFPGSDKIVHAIIYGIFSFLLLKDYLRINPPKLINILLLLVAVLFYSIGIEILQSLLTATRTAEMLDVLANLGGIIAGTIFYIGLKKIKF